MVSLRHEIVSGDVVEILTQKNHTPSRLAQLCQISHARSEIRQWINLMSEEATDRGAGRRVRHFDGA
jgi:GTP pyrophosphokinase